MTVYYLILLMLAMLSYQEITGNHKNYHRLLAIAIIAIFVGIRYKVGNDYAEYYQLFYDIKDGTKIYFEPFFLLITRLFRTPEQVFLVLSLITFSFLYKAIRYFTKDYFMVALTIYFGMYCVIFNIHIIRQGVAIAIVIYAYRFLIEKKLLTFILFVLLAMSFHVSALIVIPVALLARVKLDTRVLIGFLCAIVILLIFNDLYRKVIFNLVSKIGFLSRYASVYDNERWGSSMGVSIGLIFDFLLMLFFIIKKPVLNEKDRFIFNLFYLSVLLTMLLSSIAVFSRLNYYFRIMNVFVISHLLFAIKPKLIAWILIIVYTLLYLYMVLNTGHAVVEYQTIFSSDP